MYMQGLVGDVNQYTSVNQTHNSGLFLTYVSTAAVIYQSSQMMTFTLNQFWKFVENGEKLDPNLRESVYCGAVLTGGAKEYYKVRELYLIETDVTEKLRLVI
jgi:hypothetical protein